MSEIKCPVCGCEQIYADKKGFSTGKAVAGTVLTGNLLIGALAGSHGKDKVELTCLKCGHKFYPGDPLSVNNTVLPSDTDQYLASPQDLPKRAIYKCSCGKESSLDVGHPYCPKCGRYLSPDNIVRKVPGQEANKGCAAMLLIPLILGVGLIALL